MAPRIIRLQGLDVKAGAEDIRKFFERLHIPTGGVIIVGGQLKEAFIAFTTDKDAQLAMRYTGNALRGSPVTLHKSNMVELEHKLKLCLKKRKEPLPTQPTAKRLKPAKNANLPRSHTPPLDPHPCPTPRSDDRPQDPRIANLLHSNSVSLDFKTAYLLGICTVLQGLQSSAQGEISEAVQKIVCQQPDGTVVPGEVKAPEQSRASAPGYVRLFGLPASTTKEDVCHFFRGLAVEETIVNVRLGPAKGCLVKFASEQDARDALVFDKQSFGSICVGVRQATEKMWTRALQEIEDASNVKGRVEPMQSALKDAANHKPELTPGLKTKRRFVNKLTCRLPKKARPDCDSAAASVTMEHVVMVSNLPKTMTKTEIKELFGCRTIAHKNVLHLLDKDGNRTDTAFLIFNQTEDYDYAMHLNGCHVGPYAIAVSSTTKELMRDMITKDRPRILNKKPAKRKPNASEKPKRLKLNMKMDSAAVMLETCMQMSNKVK